MTDTINACVIHPYLKTESLNALKRAPEVRLEEAVSLTRAIEGLNVVYQDSLPLRAFSPSALLTKGHIENIKVIVEDNEIDLVVFDHTLTPVQQRNLEKRLNVKVIDRTGLILEIFGARAQTKEGKLQVELAAMSYQKSRLVRSWTHLERQRGGHGTTGGPGETQIEIDRRLIGDRIVRLKSELEKVRKTRKLQRKARREVPYPIVALVGYTNAGKSTLFNTLTGAEVFAKDLLFATLDTTMRAIDLTPDLKVILSDTVGFISELPTHLIAAFRATLEEVEYADVVVHVRDISSPQTEIECADVLETLKYMGIETEGADNYFEVYNKIDILSEEAKETYLNTAERHDHIIATSAMTGEGLDDFKQALITHFQNSFQTVDISLSYNQGDIVSWVHENCVVLNRIDDENGIQLTLKAAPHVIAKLYKKCGMVYETSGEKEIKDKPFTPEESQYVRS